MFNHAAIKFICNRCKQYAGEDPEMCWYCGRPLCEECWNKFGHCGHPEADEMNEKARQVQQPKKYRVSYWTLGDSYVTKEVEAVSAEAAKKILEGDPNEPLNQLDKMEEA